jgi:hypothetical protein
MWEYLQEYYHKWGWGSIVGMATRCMLDDPELEIRWKQEIVSFLHPPRLALESTQPPVQWIQVLLPGNYVTGA